jgi:hypothetical protein
VELVSESVVDSTAEDAHSFGFGFELEVDDASDAAVEFAFE